MASSKPHLNNRIALLCTIHTSSSSATQSVIELLSNAKSYYTKPEAQCTTWCYFSPSTRRKAPSQLVAPSEHETTICGMEIYTDKQALSTQQQEDWFKDFQRQVKNKNLYSTEGEELVVWYPAAGFVARTNVATPYGGVVMLALFTCKEGTRDTVVQVLERYTTFVREREPGVLTYCTLTRPKAPNQILLFERYRDNKALAAHGSTTEFKTMFKDISPHIEKKQTKLQEFKELENVFVSNNVGAGHNSVSGVTSKL